MSPPSFVRLGFLIDGHESRLPACRELIAEGVVSPRLGRRMARFNRLVTNRVTGPLAPWLPGFGVIVHVGRKSGREYRTPVNVFRNQGQYVVALTYGRDADWVRNVQAAGGCDLVTRGRRHRLTAPQLVHDESRQRVPRPVRAALRLQDVADFLVFDEAEEGEPTAH
jgi:deazaflavin-dependent oxidoreductase (nitroreductase family)